MAATRKMIAALKDTKNLAGARGRQKGDLDALAQALMDVSNLAQTPTFSKQWAIGGLSCRRAGELSPWMPL